MEFDADRYEATLAGSTTFGDTALRLRALSRAFGEVDKRNAGTWREHKLLRDIPRAVAVQVECDLSFPLSRLEAFDEQRHLPGYRRIIDWQTPARLALLRTAGLYRQRIEYTLGAGHLRSEPLLALSPLYADVESLQEAWIVAGQFEGDGDAAQHVGLERIRHDAMVACQEHSMRLLRKCDEIPQTLLEGNSIGGYLRRRCPRVAQPTSGPAEFVAIAGTLLDSLAYLYRLAFAGVAQRCARAEREHGIAGIDDGSARARRGIVGHVRRGGVRAVDRPSADTLPTDLLHGRNGRGMRVSGHDEGWHAPCPISPESFIPPTRRTVMKFETLMLRTLFGTCALICLLAMGTMLTGKVPASIAAASHAPVAAVAGLDG